MTGLPTGASASSLPPCSARSTYRLIDELSLAPPRRLAVLDGQRLLSSPEGPARANPLPFALGPAGRRPQADDLGRVGFGWVSVSESARARHTGRVPGAPT